MASMAKCCSVIDAPGRLPSTPLSEGIALKQMLINNAAGSVELQSSNKNLLSRICVTTESDLQQ